MDARCIKVYINSKYRDNYYNTSASNFIYNFPITIKNIISLRLHSFCIPKAWYNISNYIGNTKFTIIVRKRDPRKMQNPQYENKLEIEIPDGNWTAKELVRYLNNHFFCKSSIKWLSHITVSLNEYIKTINFEVIPKDRLGLENTIDLIFSDAPRSLGWTMGFRMGTYKNISNCISAESPFDKGHNRFIYISIKDFNYNWNASNIVFLDNNTMDMDILGKIYMKKDVWHISVEDMADEESLKKREYSSPIDISKIHIKLYDEYGTIVDLNNMDFSLDLEFICVQN